MSKQTHLNTNAEERYQAFIQNSNEGIWRFELDEPIPVDLPIDEQINLIYRRAYLAEANMVMAYMYGFDSVESVIGIRLSDVHVTSDETNRAYLRSFIESGYKLSGVDSHEKDRYGNDKYFKNSLVGIVKNGKLVRAWGTQQDITNEHDAIEALKKSERLKAANTVLRDQKSQLVALNKSKDEFISLASHQLRTPATGVKQYLGMLIDGFAGKLTKQQMQLLKTAYESNERQLTIIDDLLRVAHVDAGKVVLHKSKTELVKLLKDVIGEQQDTFRSREQKIHLSHDRKQIFADVDKAKIRMVFENIIDNASKYSPIKTDINIHVSIDKTCINVSIEDKGVGISKKDIPNLFQKFVRVRNPLSAYVGGTGIGLYWARKIVLLHGGDIEVKSKLRHGSTFTITIPAHQKSTR